MTRTTLQVDADAAVVVMAVINWAESGLDGTVDVEAALWAIRRTVDDAYVTFGWAA